MAGKRKLSVTVDADLVAAAKRDGVTNLSAWINEAIRLRITERDDKLRALAAYMADYEAEFGVITEEESLAVRRSLNRK